MKGVRHLVARKPIWPPLWMADDILEERAERDRLITDEIAWTLDREKQLRWALDDADDEQTGRVEPSMPLASDLKPGEWVVVRLW